MLGSKFRNWWVLSVFLLVSPALAAADSDDEYNPDRLFTPAQLQEDFAVFRESLETGHGGLYAHTAKPELDAVFAAEQARLVKPMTERELMLGLMRVIKAIHDGHTGLGVSTAKYEWLGTQPVYAPFKIKFIGGRAFTRYNYTANAKERVGEEILSINGRPMGAVIRDMMALVTADGTADAGVYFRLEGTQRFSMTHTLLYGPTTEWRFRLQDLETGHIRELTTTGVTRNQMAERFKARYDTREPQTELSWHGDTPVLRMSGMSMEVDETPIREFFKNTFEAINRRKVQHLVIDFRENSGGYDVTGAYLMAHLLDQPFRYYDALIVRSKQTPYAQYLNTSRDDLNRVMQRLTSRGDGTFDVPEAIVGVQQPATPHFAGRVTVLIGPQTFSAATETLAVMWAHKRARLVGTETSGAAVGNTSGFTVNLSLPNTDISLNMPLYRYHQAVGDYPFPERGFLPDYVKAPTLKEVLEDKDPVLAFALALE